MPVKFGIAGYGYAAATFHAPLILATPGLVLAAVSSRDAAKVHARLPGLPVFPAAEELFAQSDIDLIVIPTPNDTHYPLAVQALAAGKHVVVDKPFTLDTREARDLVARADKAGKLLSVFHNRRWDSDFLTVRKILADGILGRVTHFESHFDRYRPDVPDRWRDAGGPGSGLWYDLGPHLLDQALCLFGMPDAILLDLARQRDGARADDWFHAILSYNNGPRVILHASALTAVPGARFTAHGTKGSFIKHGLDPQEDALKSGAVPGGPDWGRDPAPGELTLRDGQGLARKQSDGVPGDYTRYYAGIRDAILTGAPNPVPAEQALQVMELIERGLQSAAERRFVTAG